MFSALLLKRLGKGSLLRIMELVNLIDSELYVFKQYHLVIKISMECIQEICPFSILFLPSCMCGVTETFPKLTEYIIE